jgi:hypothetical protein
MYTGTSPEMLSISAGDASRSGTRSGSTKMMRSLAVSAPANAAPFCTKKRNRVLMEKKITAHDKRKKVHVSEREM